MIEIFNFLYVGFGYVLEFAYNITGTYALALLIFAIFVKLLLFPLGIKQQKNSIKQARLRPKEAAIRKKYAGRTDKPTQQKMQQEVMDLYSSEKFNPLSGCLPLLVQLPILIILLSVIRNPLTYVSHLSENQSAALYQVYYNETNPADEKDDEFEWNSDFEFKKDDDGKYVSKAGEAMSKDSYNYQLKIIQFLDRDDISDESKALINQIVGEDFEAPDFNMFGVNLMYNPSVIFDDGGFASNWVLTFIPILTFVASFFGQRIQKKFTYTPETQNPAGTGKMLTWFLPLFSVYISFIWCAAIGLYWIYQNVLSVVQQYLLSRMYPLPVFTDEEMKQAEREYFGRAQKLQKIAPVNPRRSLVYDDDDDDSNDNQPQKTSGRSKNSAPKKTLHPSIEPAPLKDEDDK